MRTGESTRPGVAAATEPAAAVEQEANEARVPQTKNVPRALEVVLGGMYAAESSKEMQQVYHTLSGTNQTQITQHTGLYDALQHGDRNQLGTSFNEPSSFHDLAQDRACFCTRRPVFEISSAQCSLNQPRLRADERADSLTTM